jgi:hypothetical protein
MKVAMSCNYQQNSILWRIVFLCQEHAIWITTDRVSSLNNLADGPSRSDFPPATDLFPFPLRVPYHLKSFIKPSVNHLDLKWTFFILSQFLFTHSSTTFHVYYFTPK